MSLEKLNDIKVLAFDVFGTVVDWHGSVAREVDGLNLGISGMVAAHHDDLAAARACGLKTAYIERPLECGLSRKKDVSPNPENSLHAESIVHLATLLEC